MVPHNIEKNRKEHKEALLRIITKKSINNKETIPQETIPEPETGTNTPPTTTAELVRLSENYTRHDRRDVPFAFSTRDLEGAIPQIGGVLGLRSESVTKKISYDTFIEKLRICIITELKGGE